MRHQRNSSNREKNIMASLTSRTICVYHLASLELFYCLDSAPHDTYVFVQKDQRSNERGRIMRDVYVE